MRLRLHRILLLSAAGCVHRRRDSSRAAGAAIGRSDRRCDCVGAERSSRGRGADRRRFRPQGRSRDGLDCIGAAAAAIDAACRRLCAARRLGARLAGLRGRAAPAAAEPGDVLVLAPGPAQLHLGIFTGDGLRPWRCRPAAGGRAAGAAALAGAAGIWRIGED